MIAQGNALGKIRKRIYKPRRGEINEIPLPLSRPSGACNAN